MCRAFRLEHKIYCSSAINANKSSKETKKLFIELPSKELIKRFKYQQL